MSTVIPGAAISLASWTVLPLALALYLPGHALGQPRIPDGTIGQTSQPLVNAGGPLWTKNANTVPMCWHETLQFASPSAASDAKAFVFQTIQDGWINLLNLSITWTDCPTSGDARHVRVKLRAGDGSWNGTTIKTGMDTLSAAAERLVQPPNDPPGLLMGFPANWNENDATRAGFRSLILHEFGHILGFAHEQTRPDGPNSVVCYNNKLPPAVTIGPADPTSIMGWGYCTTALGALSPGDVRGARDVYGTGHSAGVDFSTDGRADILWHNASTNETQIWFLSVRSRIGRATVIGENGSTAIVGLPWTIVGTNDFDRDGKADILWHNSATNETQIWFMDGSQIHNRATVVDENNAAIFVGPPWTIVATGNFNQGGKADILWHNTTTNETQIWFMDASKISGRSTVVGEDNKPILIGAPWTIVGSADFDQDGTADILWHNSTTNETQIWFMAGFKIKGRATVVGENGSAALVGPPWTIVGTNDFNVDGKSDILWHNSSTGESQIWFMDTFKVTGRGTIEATLDGGGALIGPPWAIVGH